MRSRNKVILAVVVVIVAILVVGALVRHHEADVTAACIKRVLISQGSDANQAALSAYPASYNGQDPNAPSVGDIDYAMLMCNASSP
jgi:hypothetical protein